ncbi:MAG: helix-hairpin-helix domain-containing protein [Candidatus Micrarchaeota archaeon]|nr:helix-hairpin-helix domain-containing protein [Candidatus Micrarchaeota archaeon]
MVNEAPKILVDSREPAEISDWLEAAGAEIEITNLPIGDYQLSSRLIVERKTRQDFESSIIDGRLFSQAELLASAIPRTVIIVEGQAEQQRVSRNALLGAYASLISDFGFSLFFTSSLSSTAELIFALACHEQLSKNHPRPILPKRKARTLAEQQLAVVESLPGVGPKLARQLLLYFDNIENIVTAPEAELVQAGKIGQKKAKRLRQLFSLRFKEE